jgi:hypothetical protein
VSSILRHTLLPTGLGTRLLAPALIAAAVALAAPPLAEPATAAAAPAGNPPQNSAPSAATVRACLTPHTPIANCDTHALADVDAARRGEGVAPMTLPGDFAALPVPQRLLALVDLERVDRGLPPALGLTGRLNAAARRAAAAETDPIGPSGYSWGSNWAGGTRSTVFDDFSWMYDDGFGSQNLACQSPTDSGCWGHRDNVLASFEASVAMGASVHAASLTELLVGAYQPAANGADPLLSPTWAQIAQTLPVGVSVRAVHLSRGARVTRLRIWASGEAMSVTAAIAAGHDVSAWSVAPAHCQLTAGSGCTLSLRTGARHRRATLVLSGPNGRQSIPLS